MSTMTSIDGTNRWYFSKEKIQNSPSRKCGIDEDKEISYRQHAANFIQDMGQRLQVTQLCINTAIVYMHRFYMFHSFTKFHRNAIAACALFLAAKVEEQPRKLEHVIKVAHWCLNQRPNKQGAQLDTKNPEYIRQANELVINENIMLQTLGFEIGIEHPHTSVVKCCQLVKASKDLAQTSYFMATSSLHLTTMCLQYKPTIVACFCIHMACKWSNWEIPVSNEGKQWFCYVDETVTLEMLESLTSEFLFVFEKLSDRLKKKTELKNNPFDHRPMILPSLSSSSNDKKPSSNTTQQNEQDKQRSSTKTSSTNSETQQFANNKLIPPQPSISRTATSEQSSSIHNHLPTNNNLISKSLTSSSTNKPYDTNKSSSHLFSSSLPPSISKAYSNSSNVELNDKNNNKNLNPINPKPPTKQQQIQLEKQRQQDERNRIRPKNQDYLWDNTNKPSNITKQLNNSLSSSTTNSFLNNNNSSSTINHSFFDNLIHSSSIYNGNSSNSSNDNNSLSKSPKMNWDLLAGNSNEDSFDPKKDLNSDLKMEFSDNDSNQSVNLNTLPSLFMNDTMNDAINGQLDNPSTITSKPNPTSLFMTDTMNDALNGQLDNPSTITSKPNTTSSISTVKNSSFMSIFKNEDTTTSKNNNNNNANNSTIIGSSITNSILDDAYHKPTSMIKPSLTNSIIGSSLTNSILDDAYLKPTSMIKPSLTNSILDDAYLKPSSGKSKSKDKDRDSKHHKKHKSKDKHKKHKSKDKDRSSKHSSTEDKKLPSPIKLIIKKGVNEKPDDNNSNGDEKPLDKLKIVIPRNILGNATSSDRKRRQSPKDCKDKRVKVERD